MAVDFLQGRHPLQQCRDRQEGEECDGYRDHRRLRDRHEDGGDESGNSQGGREELEGQTGIVPEPTKGGAEAAHHRRTLNPRRYRPTGGGA
ncbi:hypothetical protein GCM10009559_47850 [Pseudonocardia zijingensis]|uniref:Uncharacterized protein n=1 Tax=Pseudonocardia zijingensis TaxID=153376 RepID=A0ABP4BG05_9PSEU